MAPRHGDGRCGGGGVVLSLPEEMIVEVLLRLPANALCRFRCVCKPWRALISDPAFVAAHRSRAGRIIVAMFGFAPELELRLLDNGGNVHRAFKVRGSSSSLLARTRLDLVFVDRAELGATIIDPASGRHFTVVGTNGDPPLPAPSPSAVVSDYSFGRAAASGDYKVLHLITWLHRPGHRTQWCEVATIMDVGAEEPTWRKRPWGPFFDARFPCENKATINGVLYFMRPASDARNRIAAFDLESEEWKPKTIQCPALEHNEQDPWHIALTELKGTLSVVQNIPVSLGGHCVNIWLLVDPDKSIWVKEYRIHMPAGLLLFTKPLDILGDGTMLLLLNVSLKARNAKNYYFLQFYNSSTKDFTDFMEMARGFNGTMTFYTGNLLS